MYRMCELLSYIMLKRNGSEHDAIESVFCNGIYINTEYSGRKTFASKSSTASANGFASTSDDSTNDGDVRNTVGMCTFLIAPFEVQVFQYTSNSFALHTFA